MDNPTQYLKAYLTAHYPGLGLSSVYSQARERVAYCWGHIILKGVRWDFRFMIPRSAPEDGRPLCTTVKRDGIVVWNFEEDHKLFQGLRQKFRVHLHEIKVQDIVQYMLVEVLEGEPDCITRIFRMDGEEFMFNLECVLKVQVARLWGTKTHFSADEKQALDALMLPQKKKV